MNSNAMGLASELCWLCGGSVLCRDADFDADAVTGWVALPPRPFRIWAMVALTMGMPSSVWEMTLDLAACFLAGGCFLAEDFFAVCFLDDVFGMVRSLGG